MRARYLIAGCIAACHAPAEREPVREPPPPAQAAPLPELPTDVSQASAAVVSGDGAYVAIVDDGTTDYSLDKVEPYRRVRHVVRVWSTLEGRVLFATRGDRVLFARGAAGEQLVVIVDAEEIHVLDGLTGAERWHRGDDQTHLYDLAVDQRGRLSVLSAPHDTLTQLDLATGHELRAVANSFNRGRIAMAADGGTAVIGSAVFDMAAEPTKLGDLAATLDGEIRISPDGQTIAVADGRHVTLLGRDAVTRAKVDQLGGSISFLDDGTLVALDGKHLTRWHASGKQLGELALSEGLAIGAGGHVVARRDRELALLSLDGTAIARFGWASRVNTLAWAPDGKRLGLATARDEVMVWTIDTDQVESREHRGVVRGLAYDANGLVIDPDWWRRVDYVVHGRRVFIRDASGHAAAFGEAPEFITTAARGGDTVVAAGASGAIAIWSTTGEGLGTLPGHERVSALAVRPDGRTLAVGRVTGGIELWDLPSRTIVAVLAAWPGGRVAYDSRGAVAGDARVLRWSRDGQAVPYRGTPMPLRVRDVLVTAPPTWSSRTPPAMIAARGCIPSGATYDQLMVDELIATYCFTNLLAVGVDPACFRADLASGHITPVSPPLDVLAPSPRDEPPTATLEHAAAGLVACTPAQVCHTLPIAADAAISDDGTLVASWRGRTVETWEVATGHRIARFEVMFGSGGRHREGFLVFWSHDVVAMFGEDSGPLRDGTVFSARGARLGDFPVNAGGMPVHMHDDVWLVSAGPGRTSSTLLLDATTGHEIAHRDLSDGSYVVTPNRIVQLHADPAGEVEVLDRKLVSVEKLPPPPACP